MEALLIPVGDELHAVELPLVREVVKAPVHAPVPGAPAWVLGLANLRGQIVPVFDTAQALGDEPLAAHSHVAVVDTPKGIVAIAASRMPGPVRMDEQIGASERRGAKGRYAVHGTVASLLDLPALVG